MNEQGTLPVVDESGAGALTRAAEATIQAKRDAHLLTAEHELTVQAILGMARAVDRGLAYGKVSIATTTMLREMREALASLPTSDTAGAGAEWDKIVADLSA